MSQSLYSNVVNISDYRPLENALQVSAQTRSQWVGMPSDERQIFIQKSSWIEELSPKFQELMALPVGWDGYAGLPVSFDCVCFVVQLIDRLSINEIEAPQVVPGSDGSLQLEWHNYGYDVELNILAPSEVLAFRRDVNTGVIEELDLTTDYTVVYSWIMDMRNAHINQLIAS